MLTQRVKLLAAAWFAGEYTMFDACTERPEIAWQAILEISQHDLTDEQKALLAGGPLETLLAWHGADFIGLVEEEARRSPRFNHLLGGVWRQEMLNEVWEGIERTRKEGW